jgi:hypothetical protein
MMNGQNVHKLNNLLKVWPRGTVAVSSWLKTQGVYRQLSEAYVKSSWIDSIGHGAFKHSEDPVDWPGGVYALVEQLNLHVHVGGRSALELQGHMHFVPLGENYPVYLFGLTRFLPVWFREQKWKRPVSYVHTSVFPYNEKAGLTRKDMGSFSITLSSRELAIMEVLYLVDQNETYEHAALLMEGLNTLRPDLVQELLEKTSSIKVKRLFMHFAEKFDHSWFKRVKKAKINLGKGKRVIGGGGNFDSKYNLSVPKINL